MKTLIRHATSRDFQMLLSLDEACFPPEIAYDSRNRKMATLVTLDVHGEHRRKGYASTLLARSEQILFEQGVAIYSLQVDTQNEGAISFYRKNGFEVERLLRKYYPGSRDAWQMVKKLPTSGDK